MILIVTSNREKAGIILSRTSEPTDLGPIWSVFVRKSDSKSAPKSAPKYLDRTGLTLSLETIFFVEQCYVGWWC